MAILKASVKSEILDAFKTVMEDEGDRVDALESLSDILAEAVINAIRSAEIVYTAGLVAPAMGGPVTGTFEGELI